MYLPHPPAFLHLLPLPRRASSTSRTVHHLCTRAALSTPDGLANIRDLASAAPHQIRPHKIFRGSTPASLPSPPSPESVAFLRATSVLLDLRSNDERASDNLSDLLSACGPDFPDREVHIGLLNKRRVVYGLARALPRNQVKELAWRAFSRPQEARKVVAGRMDQGGLVLLNRILVDVGAAGIGRALRIVADAVSGIDKRGDQHDDNIGAKCYFYCSAGKDRTGLLAALILEVLGVDRKYIVRDYVRSSETWENGPFELRQNYCARLKHAGLTPVNWLGAPPEVMDETLRFIDRTYGSVEDYLIHCGFGEDKMNQLREAMAV